MLWYKGWRESRSRFLLAAGAVAIYSLAVLVFAQTAFPPPQAPHLPYSAFVWSEFYGPWRAVAFSIIALVFGLGGLQRERALGTAAFTLALPVSRAQLVCARFVIGLVELTAIVMIPLVVVPTLSPVFVRQTYPWSQSVEYAALFMSWGVVWFAIGFTWSALFAGEFTAASASILSPFGYLVIYANVSQGGRRFLAANPFAMMSGDLDLQFNGRQLLTGHPPWLPMFVLVLVVAALLVCVWRVTVRQNY